MKTNNKGGLFNNSKRKLREKDYNLQINIVNILGNKEVVVSLAIKDHSTCMVAYLEPYYFYADPTICDEYLADRYSYYSNIGYKSIENTERKKLSKDEELTVIIDFINVLNTPGSNLFSGELRELINTVATRYIFDI